MVTKNYLLKDVVAEVGISYFVLYRMIQRGEVKAFRYHKRGFWHVSQAEVDRLKGEQA